MRQGESEGSNEVMLIHVHQITLLICSWQFCIAALNEQLQTERAHVPQSQLWSCGILCPHTSHLHSRTALEVVVRLAINAFLLFHPVFHLDAQTALKVQQVLLLMAYFTLP